MRTAVWTPPASDRDLAPSPPAGFSGADRQLRRPLARIRRVPWLLLVVLTFQAVGSLSLVKSNTAFQDEALYLWAGHLELASWLHGTPIPAFPTYFSGAPILYPPLGAIADSLGGLAAARILSLGFMLVATALLWGTANRLYGRRAAFFACAVFALLGVTMRLGAFATYDAMSLCLMALAAWCAVHAGEQQKSSGWLVAAAFALTLANATKYASALFDPVVIGLLVLTAARMFTWRHAAARGATMLAYVIGMCAVLLAIGGGEYWTGIAQTTLARVTGSASASAVFAESWHLTAVVIILGAAGVLVCLAARSALPACLLICLVAGAALLVPLEQAHIHTLTSLDKHVAFGAWFAAVAAGYAVNRIISWVPARPLRQVAGAVCVLGLLILSVIGVNQAKALFRTWPNSTHLVETASSLLRHARGSILSENPSLLEYYVPEGKQWELWSSTCTIRVPDGHSISPPVGTCLRPTVYAKSIKQGFFSVVILLFGNRGAPDSTITQALKSNHHYHLAAKTHYGGRGALIWEFQPQHHFPSELAALRTPATTPLEGLLIPAARPSPILGPIVAAVGIAGVVTIMFTVCVRHLWRRRKTSYEV